MITGLKHTYHTNTRSTERIPTHSVTFGLKSIPYRPSKAVFEVDPKNGIDPLPLLTPQGHILNCYYRPPKPGMPTVMFLHGAGKSAAAYTRKMPAFLKEEGYGIMLAEYRGFGNSTPAKPSENSAYQDAHNVLVFLNKQKNTPPGDIIIWGNSLGGATAADLASKHKFKGVILDSTFTSFGDVIKNELEGPIGKLINWLFRKNKFKTIEKVPKIESPVLILHSKEDEIVPYQMAERNFEALTTEHKHIVIDDEAEHSDMRWKDKPIADFIHEL